MVAPFYTKFTAPRDKSYAAKFGASIKIQNKVLDDLDDYLNFGGTLYIAGDNLTIADIHIFHESTSDQMMENVG